MTTRDVLAVAGGGLRTRRLRAALAALGIAVGIAALVAVLGIGASSRAGLLAQLDALGTNLLTVAPGRQFGGDQATLADTAALQASRVGGVRRASAARVLDATVRRTDRIDPLETGGISVVAVDASLLGTLEGRLARGTALLRGRTAVLGRAAAERLGIARPGPRVYVDGSWWTVTGVLEPMPLAPELDRSVLVGFGAAAEALGEARSPTTVYLRAATDRVEAVRGLLPTAVAPGAPEEVEVSRPSDALAARAAADTALTGLLVGLGAVALLVGGIGIANTMVVAVLERRGEVGLRRALGATRGDVRAQFFGEAVLLSGLGGVAGLALGAGVTAVVAGAAGWSFVLPLAALAGGPLAALAVGAAAGLVPAARAARLAPAEALRA